MLHNNSKSQQVFKVTTFCMDICFQSFSPLISCIVHCTVLKFSPCRNKPLSQLVRIVDINIMCFENMFMYCEFSVNPMNWLSFLLVKLQICWNIVIGAFILSFLLAGLLLQSFCLCNLYVNNSMVETKTMLPVCTGSGARFDRTLSAVCEWHWGQ